MGRSVHTFLIERSFAALVGLFSLCLAAHAWAAGPDLLPGLSIFENVEYPPEYYLKESKSAHPVMKQELILKAVSGYLVQHRYKEANRNLKLTDSNWLTLKQKYQSQLLSAQLALALNQPSIALDILNSQPVDLPEPLSAVRHDLLANAYVSNREYLLSIQERVQLADLLEGLAAREANNAAIWETLQYLPVNTINAIQYSTPPGVLRGWLSLAYLANSKQLSQEQLYREALRWKEQYPNHPGMQLITDTLNQSAANQTAAVQRIALLLPISGEMGKTGKIIQNGFLNSYYLYQAKQTPHPEVRVYDTSKSVQAAYENALKDDADFIVGPLTKENVATLQKTARTVPLLALNYSDQTSGHTQGFYQFGLSPRDEARQIAERGNQDGLENALVIYQNAPWSQSMRETFNTRWRGLNGHVLSEFSIDDKTNIAQSLKKILEIDEKQTKILSNPKKYEKKQPNPEEAPQPFEDLDAWLAEEEDALDTQEQEGPPVHRQDIDMIVLLTDAATARQIVPVLKFYFAQDIPVYATSLVHSTGQMEDKDLEGVMFCDMPWVIDSGKQAELAKNEIGKHYPNTYNQQARLYAFGMDAYVLATTMTRLHTFSHFGLPGFTGTLYLNDQNKIYRQLPWAQFKRGMPILIDGET